MLKYAEEAENLVHAHEFITGGRKHFRDNCSGFGLSIVVGGVIVTGSEEAYADAYRDCVRDCYEIKCMPYFPGAPGSPSACGRGYPFIAR